MINFLNPNKKKINEWSKKNILIGLLSGSAAMIWFWIVYLWTK